MARQTDARTRPRPGGRSWSRQRKRCGTTTRWTGRALGRLVSVRQPGSLGVLAAVGRWTSRIARSAGWVLASRTRAAVRPGANRSFPIGYGARRGRTAALAAQPRWGVPRRSRGGSSAARPLRARGRAATRARGEAATRARGRAATRARGEAATRARGKAATRARGEAATRARGKAATRARGTAAVTHPSVRLKRTETSASPATGRPSSVAGSKRQSATAAAAASSSTP